MSTPETILNITPDELEELEKRFAPTDLDKAILQGYLEGKDFLFMKGRQTGGDYLQRQVEQLFAKELKEGTAIIISEDEPLSGGMKAFEEGFSAGANRRSRRKQNNNQEIK